MLGAVLVNRVGSELDRCLIVLVENCRQKLGKPEPGEKATEPDNLCARLGGGHVLGFARGECDRGLELAAPRHRGPVEEEDESTDGTARVGISSPVGVCEAIQTVEGALVGGATVGGAVVGGAFEVPKEMLGAGHM